MDLIQALSAGGIWQGHGPDPGIADDHSPFPGVMDDKFGKNGGCWCCCSVAQSCPTLCDLMDCSTPGFPVYHHLPELAQTHVLELVMPSHHLILFHPLLLLPSIFPSIGVFSNQSVLHIRGQSIGSSALASVLPKNIQDWSPLGWTGLISLQSKGLLGVFSNTTV